MQKKAIARNSSALSRLDSLQVAAQAIKEAVLSTTLRANLNVLNQQLSFEKTFFESEKSCYSDSENEEGEIYFINMKLSSSRFCHCSP